VASADEEVGDLMVYVRGGDETVVRFVRWTRHVICVKAAAGLG